MNWRPASSSSLVSEVREANYGAARPGLIRNAPEAARLPYPRMTYPPRFSLQKNRRRPRPALGHGLASGDVRFRPSTRASWLGQPQGIAADRFRQRAGCRADLHMPQRRG